MNDNITVSRELLRQVLAQLEINRTNFRKGPSKSICKMLAGGNDEAINALRAALEQPAPVQEPSNDVVAGAIFDFAGFLTSHKEMIEVGSCSNASPMVERIKEWSSNRGLSLVNPDVYGWQMRASQPRKAVKLTEQELRDIVQPTMFDDYEPGRSTLEYLCPVKFGGAVQDAVLKANEVTE